MKQTVISKLNSIARQCGIVIIKVNAGMHDPDVAIVEDKVIFMNVSFNTKFSYAFRLAHELAHLIDGDTGSQVVYAFSPYSKKMEERHAHEFALNFLAALFFQDTPVEYRNYVNFMDVLGLPAYFEDMAREAVMQA